MPEMENLVIVGAGAAGLAAAVAAGEAGLKGVLVLEKNDRPGVKLLISGGGRCNVTTAASARETVAAFGPGGRFLHNSLGAFPPERIRDWLAETGVPTHVEEPGGKVFPDSDRARDVVAALARRAEAAGARIACGRPATAIVRENGAWRISTPQGDVLCHKVILTSGGASYRKTGTTGDAYAWLEALGHRIVPIRPALSPWTVALPWVHALSGLTLADSAVSLDLGLKRNPTERGGFLFTHQGVSGPAPMNLTRWVPRGSKPPYRLLLEPSERIPARLAAILKSMGDPKGVPLEPAEPMGFDKAEVTQGGVALDEVDPKTMASKKAPGLYIAGELLDLEGPIGGFNLAAAWATGVAAGKAAASPCSP